jgi:hypothetical protein
MVIVGKTAPFRAGLTNLKLLLQVKVGLALFAPVLPGWLVSFVLDRAR